MDYLRAYRDMSTGDDLVFVASTPGVKRDGLAIDQDRWDLSRYEHNPVFLWVHDYRSLPVGRAEAWVESGVLKARVVKWASGTFAREVEQAYRDGILNAVSVGWEDVDEDGKPIRRGQTAARHVLQDISAVPVPGDPDALMERRRRAWSEIGRELLRLATSEGDDDMVDEGDEGEGAWADTAAAMVAVFDRESDDPDEERQKRYRALLPKYRRQGVPAPEFVPADDLRALGDAEWAALFLAGELDAVSHTGARVGAVLNARNRALLSEAVENIRVVLNSAEKPDTPERMSGDNETEQRSADEADTDPQTDPDEGEPTPPLADTDDDDLATLRSWSASLHTEADNG